MYFIDVQGTLLSDKDKSLLPGSLELISTLNASNTPYVVLTNNSKDLNLLKHLQDLGLKIAKNAYLDPLSLLAKKGLKKACIFGGSSFKTALKALGIEEDERAEDVIFTNWEGYDFKTFAKMIEKRNSHFIAMNATSLYSKNSQTYPGCGGIAALLAYCINPSLEVLGKPSKDFFSKALKLLGVKKASFLDVCIISDDFRGDLIEAKKLGMRTALVLSGKSKSLAEFSKEELFYLDKSYGNLKDFIKEELC